MIAEGRIVFAVVTIAGVLAQPQTIPPVGADWFGTWRLNVAKSTYSTEPPYKGGARRIAPSDNGMLIVDDLVRRRGGILHLEWTGKLDGLDYPVQGVEIVLTNAYRRVDDRTWDLVQKIDGEVVATARLAMSADGRTIATVTSGNTGHASTIHEK